MKIDGKPYQTIWESGHGPGKIHIIDQRRLPFEFVIEDLVEPEDYAFAIKEMQVRGAPLIGVTAAYGMCAAIKKGIDRGMNGPYVEETAKMLINTRPTAVDLSYAVNLILGEVLEIDDAGEQYRSSLEMARRIRQESIDSCKNIGIHGLKILREISEKKAGGTVNVLTHCNAGWLACIDYGTATAPVYMAFDEGMDIHVWVDETRPRSQGSRLTAYELSEHGVPHTVIADNTGGHLMQHGLVDLVITGTDRTTRTGDVANKIGTYLKALAAHDNGLPFYVALPSSSIDWEITDGINGIPIEMRDEKEVTHVTGWDGEKITEVRITPEKSRAVNYGFDVTPARYVTGFITDRGVCQAGEAGLRSLYPEKIT